MPAPRGPRSAALVDLLAVDPETAGAAIQRLLADLQGSADTVHDDDDAAASEDVQLALVLVQEVQRGLLRGAHPGWQWSADLYRVRRRLEAEAERGLPEASPVVVPTPVRGDAVCRALLEVLTRRRDGAGEGWAAAPDSEERIREAIVLRSTVGLRGAGYLDHVAGHLQLEASSALRLLAAAAKDRAGVDDVVDPWQATLRHAGLPTTLGGLIDLLPGAALAEITVPEALASRRGGRAAAVGWFVASHLSPCSLDLRTRHLRMLAVPAAPRSGDPRSRDPRSHDPRSHDLRSCDVEGALRPYPDSALLDLVVGLVRDSPADAAEVLRGAALAVAVRERNDGLALRAWHSGRSALVTSPPARRTQEQSARQPSTADSLDLLASRSAR